MCPADSMDEHASAKSGPDALSAQSVRIVAVLQNGFNAKDTFDPIEELRRARAANAGQTLVDEHTKQEAVLGAALKAHGDDSANLDQDNVDVSAAFLSFMALLDAARCSNFCCKCLAQHRLSLCQASESPMTSSATLHHSCRIIQLPGQPQVCEKAPCTFHAAGTGSCDSDRGDK